MCIRDRVYGVLPAATVFMLVYSKVSTMLSKRALFYATALPFFGFYLMFKLVMYPMRDSLHPSPAAGAAANVPEGLSYMVNLYRHWTFALFYVVSELYSSVRFVTFVRFFVFVRCVIIFVRFCCSCCVGLVLFCVRSR